MGLVYLKTYHTIHLFLFPSNDSRRGCSCWIFEIMRGRVEAVCWVHTPKTADLHPAASATYIQARHRLLPRDIRLALPAVSLKQNLVVRVCRDSRPRTHLSRCGEVWYRACFGNKKPQVQVLSSRPATKMTSISLLLVLHSAQKIVLLLSRF